MLLKLKEMFKGDRKYFSIVFFIVFLIILSGIFTPIYINYLKNNWDNEVGKKIIDIESSVKNLYKEKETFVLSIKTQLKDDLEHVLHPNNTSFGRLIEVVNNEKYQEVSVEIIAPNGKMIAWNNDPAVPQETVFPLSFPAGETYFYNSGLVTFLTVLDTLHIDNDLFYFIVSLPFEKKYSLQNEYYKQLSFIDQVSVQHLTQFEIDFTPYASKSRDGRKYSFDLSNNKKSKIAVITFNKPAVTVTENKVYNDVSVFQSVLALIAFIIAGLGFRKEYRELKNNFIRLILFTIYAAGLRALLFAIDFPSRLIEGPLTDPTNFSSAFGWGIVKSPLDFFLTVFFFLLVSFKSFRFLTSYIVKTKERGNTSILLFAVLVPILASAFFMTLRGLSAGLKSVIFDSSLRYFKDPSIIPELPVLFILITVLMLALAVVLFLSSYLIISFKLIPSDQKKQFKIYSLLVLVLYVLIGVFYIKTQPEPLITILLALLSLAVIWIFIYQVYIANIRSVFNFVYAALIGSALSISLLNYYNLDLEQDSLKTTAAEINRPDEGLIRFLITEALLSSVQNSELKGMFMKSNVNYNAAAFIIWSGSALQREALSSAVIIYDIDRNELGRFSVGLTEEVKAEEIFKNLKEGPPGVSKLEGSESTKEFYAGLIPVTDRGFTSGFIAALVEYDLETISLTRIPDFLESGKKSISSVVDLSKLNIFQFQDDRLVNVYGDLYPSRDQIRPILNAVTYDNPEAWLSLSFNNEEYKTYVQAADNNITAVSLKEKHFSWRLFNFFKIFILHSFVILLLYLILYSITIRKIKYTFRTQLLLAFLVISIFPVLLLAFYNRQVVTERSSGSIVTELNERAAYLQSHINFQLSKHTERELIQAFNNAGQELAVSFSIYDNTDLVFSSAANYYNVGLFPQKINPRVYYFLNYLSFREYITEEKLDKFVYNSFYKKITIRDKNYTLCVNDAFNKINISLTAADFDIFLFGVYSFAVLIIIILSTVLANEISAPIRKLTNATESVAHGDLNVRLQNSERGEIRELINGFNYMTEELQKNEIEMAQLERENAWKEMAKQVAHEIKNPLTPMKLSLQQLLISFRDRNKNFEEIFEKVSTTLLTQIENLNQIASEFSRFARMPKFNLEAVDLVDTLRETANLFLHEQIKINLSASVDSALVESDKAQTRRMFINLIRNSIQADASEISINLYSADENYILMFTDNGEGIPEDVKSRIFEPNFTTKDKGMGIGLKISKRYLENIGGTIALKESSPAGTVFEINIPRKA